MTIQLNEGQEPLLRKRELEQALAAAGVATLAGINVDVVRAVRLPGVGDAAEALTPAEWLARYFAAKNRSPERLQQLLAAAAAVLTDDA